MRKYSLLAFVCILLISSSKLANGEITGNVTVNENLFVTFEFRGLDQAIYDQARTQLTAQSIPETIASNMGKTNQTVLWGTASIEHDDSSRTIRNSFYLGGSAIVSLTLNRTSLKRIYEVKTTWMKFKVSLADNFFIDFAQHLTKPIAEWQKTDSTTFYYENWNTGTLDILFYLTLPTSASEVRTQGDSVFYEGPPALEDQLFGTPFLILIALAVALLIILLYRKTR